MATVMTGELGGKLHCILALDDHDTLKIIKGDMVSVPLNDEAKQLFGVAWDSIVIGRADPDQILVRGVQSGAISNETKILDERIPRKING